MEIETNMNTTIAQTIHAINNSFDGSEGSCQWEGAFISGVP